MAFFFLKETQHISLKFLYNKKHQMILHKAIKKILCNALYIIYFVVKEGLMKNCFMHM
jgi:hypothetical protein